MIENVPTFFKMVLPFKNENLKITEILNLLFGHKYTIEANVYDAAEYGVAQRRTRAIIKLYLNDKKWGQPEKSNTITVEEKIGFLPSIESGQKINYKMAFCPETLRQTHRMDEVYADR